MSLYKIADVVFSYRPYTESFEKFLSPYQVDDLSPEFDIVLKKEDLFFERDNLIKEKLSENPSVAYCESLAFHRKLSTKLLNDYSAILFHASAIEYKGKAYLFTAKSGTGKSTHSSLWKKYLGDKVSYINDDKPILRLIGNKFYVFGTPFDGKHRLSSNASYPLAAICKIHRGKENKIKKADEKDFISTLLIQAIKPESREEFEKFSVLLSKLTGTTQFFDLYCDISFNAFKTSFCAITGEDYENK